MLEQNKLYNGDCLEVMKDIPDKSLDMILCDLPYGATKCKWDTIIPFEPLWIQYKRVIKDRGAIVLFGTEPFSSYLRLSNLELFKYDWVWEKSKASNYVHAKFQPMKCHEIISVFSFYPSAQNSSNKNMTYNPQFTEGLPYSYGSKNGKNNELLSMGAGKRKPSSIKSEGIRYPRTVQYFKTSESEGTFHPTQKPVALLEYLIKTYTNENELILDNCIGSGSTAIACINTNRSYIGIEKDENYLNIANKRIAEHLTIRGEILK
jgi:site-specific DNA-methyltransferase (adenine-specific)